MKYTSRQREEIIKPLLYSIVFDTHTVRYTALFLFLFFLMQPLAPALANEEGSGSDGETSSVETTVEVEQPPSIEPKVEEVPQQEVQEVEPEAEVVMEEKKTQPQTVPDEAPAEENTDEVMTSDTESGEVAQPDVLEQEITLSNEDDALVDPDETVSADAFTDEIQDSSQEQENDPQSQIDEIVVTLPDADLQSLSQVLTSGTIPTSTQGSTANVDSDADISSETHSTTTNESIDQTGSSTVSGDEVSSTQADHNSTVQEDTDITPSDTLVNIQQEEEILEDSKSVATSTDEIVQVDQAATTTASTTAEDSSVATEALATDLVINDLNMYQFSNTECVSVGDGSFYCSEKEDAPKYVEDGVFSAPDSDGDTEIFVTINGKTTQITHNLVDDASPYYDGLSDTIVWHSSKNDRFQIVQYEVQTGDITYITDTSYNNMEPVVYGELILWQAWIKNNWEILLFDGSKTTQLTNNQMHDITPQIRDGYIIWQTQFADGWKIALFDTKTKKVQYIADSDGSDIANPRFVLVYDSKDEVGDIKTLGYDFGSRSSFVLANLPAELPDEIPQPDQTGETRALINAKPTTREDKLDKDLPKPSDGNTFAPSETASSSLSVGERDILVTASTSTTPTVSAETAEDMGVSTATTTTEVSHIEDVVIPPFISTSTEEVG